MINLFSQRISKFQPPNQNFIEFGQTLGPNLAIKNIPYGPMLADANHGNFMNHNKVDERVAPPSDGDDSEIEIPNEEDLCDQNGSSLIQ